MAAEASNVTELRTDSVVVQELREEIGPLLDQICVVMAKAKAAGLGLSWNIHPDSFGRHFRVTEIAIVKPL